MGVQQHQGQSSEIHINLAKWINFTVRYVGLFLLYFNHLKKMVYVAFCNSRHKNIPLNLLTFKACCKTVFSLGFAEDRGWVKTNQCLFIFYRRDVLVEKLISSQWIKAYIIFMS